MSTLVRYTPGNRELNLAKLTSAEFQLIKTLHRHIDRGDGTLLCLESSGDSSGAEMYIRLRGGRYWAAHFAGSGHDPHPISIESDEHRRQKDYWHRAAEDAGYSAYKEFGTGGGTILDVAIDGPRRTGVEVQHSAIEVRKVKTRTTKSFRAGWLPVWFLDSDGTPPWFHHVPAVGCNRISWSALPPRRAATATTGLVHISALRCTPGAFDPCPEGKRRPCGEWHPSRQPWRHLTVDDVADLVPAEQIVPLQDEKKRVFLVSPESLKLYQDLTGRSGEYWPGTTTSTGVTPVKTTRCVNPVHDQRTPSRCACGQEIYHLAQLIRPRADLCDGCRLKAGLPRPGLPM